MSQKQFTDLTLKSLHLLSDTLSDDFAEKMQAAVRDVRQRVGLSANRTVTIKLSVKPHPEDADDVSLQCEVTSSTPARKHESLRLIRNNKTNQLRFEFSEDQL